MSNNAITVEQSFVQDLIKKAVNQQIVSEIQTLTQDQAWVERIDRLINSAIIQRAKYTASTYNFEPVIKQCVEDNIQKFENTLAQQILLSVKNNSGTLSQDLVQTLIEQAVQNQISAAIENLIKDSAWLNRIEHLINQTVVQRTTSKIASTDINTVIYAHLDKTLPEVHKKFLNNFSTAGISDQATTTQLTLMDDATVIENQLVAKSLQIVGTTQIKDLTVTGSINTDNNSWKDLATEISKKTLEKLEQDWRDSLIAQVSEHVSKHGIKFENVYVGDELLINGNALSGKITESRLQSVGHLTNLQVKGEAHIYNTLSVVNRRLGINTATPESALSVWDEEVAVIIGKHKAKQAYVGTSRDQGLALGVNREPQIEIDATGLTRIKKLQVGLHKIGHDTQVPGWSGTRGDIVFNSSPGPDRVFAWVCLGAHKWQSVKSAE